MNVKYSEIMNFTKYQELMGNVTIVYRLANS